MWWSKIPKRAKPDWCFAEPEPPEQGGEQLPFVMRSGVNSFVILYIIYLKEKPKPSAAILKVGITVKSSFSLSP